MDLRRTTVATLVLLLGVSASLTACGGEVTLPTELPSTTRSPGVSVSLPTPSRPEASPPDAGATDSPTRTGSDPIAPTRTPETTQTTEPGGSETTQTETRTRTETETITSTATGPASTSTSTVTQTETETPSTSSAVTATVTATATGTTEVSPAADAADEDGSMPWVALGALVLAIGLLAFLYLRRRSPEVTVRDAYQAGTQIRDDVSSQIAGSAPIDAFGLLSRVDAGDRVIRSARGSASGPDALALERLVTAVGTVRSAIEASISGATGTHAPDPEHGLLSALAQLDAALSDLAPPS